MGMLRGDDFDMIALFALLDDAVPCFEVDLAKKAILGRAARLEQVDRATTTAQNNDDHTKHQ